MTKYYALIGPKLDGPALNSAMTACSIEPSIRQVPRLYVNRMGLTGGKFKERYNQHMHDFRTEAKEKSTTLSKHIWELKRERVSYTVS